MKNFSRWYDKFEELKKILEFLETRPTVEQNDIAQEILQIIFTELNLPVENSMQYIDSAKDIPQKRWYDRFPELSNSLEVIKRLEEKDRQFVLVKILESIYQYYYMERGDIFEI